MKHWVFGGGDGVPSVDNAAIERFDSTKGLRDTLAMTTLAAGSRRTFHRYDLDGAALWFHPATGTNVRVDAPTTSHLRRRVPRVVMFGITNACNLTCSY